MDLDIAVENVAGGLLDLQAGGRLVDDVDPWRDRRRPRDPLPLAVARADGGRGVRHRRAVAGRAARASPPRARLRRRRDGGASPTTRATACGSCRASSRAATTRSGCSPSPGCGPAPTRPAGCSTTSAVRRRAAGPHRTHAAGEHRRRALARPGLRADDRGDPADARRQAAGGRDLPPAARAPLVRVRAAGPRRDAGRGAGDRTCPTSSPRRPTSTSSSAARRPSCSSAISAGPHRPASR